MSLVTPVKVQRSGEAAKKQAAALTIVAPVWGMRHIERFQDLVLPTWLSPNNIPALAREQDVIVRVMTRAEDRPRLEAVHGFRRLAEIADVRFSFIDDLLAPDCMPVTLTLVLHRGMAEGMTGPGQKRRSFLLLNSDFALSDGSIAYAARRLAAGAPMLLAPSLRVDEDRIRPHLRAMVDRDGVLDLSSRKMTKLAFDHLHPTVLCSQMDQSWLRCRHTHQLCWRVDEETMVARGFCLFALGLSLDRAPPPAAAFCDYGMAPLIVGDTPAEQLGHSDDFLALEIAPHDYEHALTDFGPPDTAEIAKQLQHWTTEFHRVQARSLLVFSAAEGKERASPDPAPSAAVIEEIDKLLAPPLSMTRHPHWIGGLEGWRRSREDIGISYLPAELDPGACRPEQRAAKPPLRMSLRRFLVGFERRSVWQPYFRLSSSLQRLMEHMAPGAASVAALGATKLQSFDPLSPHRQSAPEKDGLLLVGLDLRNWSTVNATARNLERLAGDGRRVALIVTQEDLAITPSDLVRIYALFGDRFETEALEYHDVRADAWAERLYGRVAGVRLAGEFQRALARYAAIPVCLAALLLRNLFAGPTPRPSADKPLRASVAVIAGRLRAQ